MVRDEEGYPYRASIVHGLEDGRVIMKHRRQQINNDSRRVSGIIRKQEVRQRGDKDDSKHKRMLKMSAITTGHGGLIQEQDGRGRERTSKGGAIS